MICLVLFAAPLVAQEHPGKEIARHFNNNAGRPCVEYRDGSQTCLDGESDMTSSPALRPQNRAKFGFRQVANRKFWLIAAGMYASAFYDVEGAQHCIRVRACKEANPILGQTRGRQYGVKLGITTAALIPVYYLKRLDMQDNAVSRSGKGFGGSLPGQVVLVLQGGGALGSYQGGVYQALHEAGIEPDWLIGTSIRRHQCQPDRGQCPGLSGRAHRRRALLGWRHSVEYADRSGVRRQPAQGFADLRRAFVESVGRGACHHGGSAQPA